MPPYERAAACIAGYAHSASSGELYAAIVPSSGLFGASQSGYISHMLRIIFATFLGLGFFFFYVVAVLALADVIGTMHWAIQFIYFAAAGILWVFPIRWLMLWAARRLPKHNPRETHGNPA